MSGWIIRRTLRRPKLALAEIAGGTLLASAFMNNTPVVIVMIPIVRRLARVLEMAATRLMIPLSYLSILGGTLTLIGTSTNLLVDGVAQEQGLAAFGIFEMTGVGLAAAGRGLLVIALLGPILLPARGPRTLDEERESDLYLSHLTLAPESKLVGRTLQDTGFFRRPGLEDHCQADGPRARPRRSRRTRAEGRATSSSSPPRPRNWPRWPRRSTSRPGWSAWAAASPPCAGKRRPTCASSKRWSRPSHPIIGRRLAEIPLLSRFQVRVLGLSRPRHVAGPSLADVRVRAGDRLLIAATADAAQALQGNVQLTDVAETGARAFLRDKAPIALATLPAW